MSDAFSLETLLNSEVKQLYAYARELEIPNYSQLSKKELALAVMRTQEEKQGFYYVEGVLDIIPSEGYGFLRPINFSPSHEDIYISSSQIRRFELRNGDKVAGPARPPKASERYSGLMQVSSVNGKDPEEAKNRDHFPSLTAIYPDRQIQLEYDAKKTANRMIDLIAPIGFGQRGIIVSPPKAGKTTVLKELANGIKANYPDTELIVLLIDERPEEVTDIERSVDGEVVYSTFDQRPENHVRITELVLERAMRLVEDGRDVIILMDSMTRLARAYNLVVKPSGRTLSGGVDPAAFYLPKRFFGAARNVENGGSLTILATALVDTGSRMDDVIYEEFKGTGNMELHLSRQWAERRLFPAVDILRSGTRKEELLMPKEKLEQIWRLRNLMGEDVYSYTQQVIELLGRTDTNEAAFVQLEAFLEAVSPTKKMTKRTTRKSV
ncbi:transcription termination factor Rho [Aerococcaceae bacterium zg-ZUI334]|uniref:transcription termination factor Rho n=1 Tax=Aerococcaceae TaxID=186827 RepID=UPI0013BC7B07|nr:MULTISPECIES: transcription termination factor Rho [unclassified Facklamia]MBR7927722.1 transcription termination factor Rho [Aerococcaceae bacterium zg-ZUI334]NEW64524.1 transcription termination factor Rho [Facklamia sp. 252]NEW67731.1 transcription termination factor Rho [Facklamia sp. 253]QQD65708.1 transcription termination factor Rho [Aerococcaceae bacterium zg-252]